MMRATRGWLFSWAVVGLLLAFGPLAEASQLRGPVQSVSRNLLRVSNQVVRLDRRTALEDMGGNVLSIEEIKPGVWVEVELPDGGGVAQRIRAKVVR